MKTVTIDFKEYTMATSWAELKPKQVLMLCKALQHSIFECDEVSANAARISAFWIVTTVPLNGVGEITASQWVDIYPHLNWIFEAPAFQENVFPVMRLGWRKLYGPVGHKMQTSSALELIEVDSAFIRMATKKKLDDLYLLAATLWRPRARFLFLRRFGKDWNGDKRKPMNRLDIIRRAKRMEKKLDPAQLMFVFMYYHGFRTHIFTKSFANLFEGKSNYKKGIDFGWHGVVLEFSNTKFGDYKNTAATNWMLFFTEMSRQKEIANDKK